MWYYNVAKIINTLRTAKESPKIWRSALSGPAQIKTTDICQPFFRVKLSKASLAVVASSGVSNITCAIFTRIPAAFRVGDHVTWVFWKPLYL